MTAWGAYRILVRWDWTREMKRKSTITAMLLIGLITLFVFSFAIPPTRTVIRDAGPGVLWLTFLLAGTIGVERAFRGDGDGRLLEGLLLAPIDRTVLYYARVSSTFLFVAAMEAVMAALFVLLFDVSMASEAALWCAAAGLAATFGFVVVGVLISAMTWSVRGGDVLLRVLLFPLLIPVLASAVRITGRAFEGRPPALEDLGIILCFDLVFLGAGHFLFEHLVRDFEGQ